MITLYTDGAACGNPGPGAYAVILEYKGYIKELVGAYRLTTNNRMELLAVIVGLEALTRPGNQVEVYSDSRYVVDALRKGWLLGWLRIDFKGKKNKDLWLRFWRVYQRHQVALHWVQGHAGHPQNERCDKLAVTAAQQGPWEVDEGYEKGHPLPWAAAR